MPLDRLFTALGAASALMGVAAGAFGAHALRARLSSEMLAVFETGVRYQMYHALGLIGVGLIASRWPSSQIGWAGWLFVAGTAIFSGSLYALSITGARGWGAVTPVGGVCLVVGWALVVWGVVRA